MYSELLRAYAKRLERFINEKSAGIDTWPVGDQQIPVTTLADAYITIGSTSHGRMGTGRVVKLFMKRKGDASHTHIVTITYGPPRTRLFGMLHAKREIRWRSYHV